MNSAQTEVRYTPGDRLKQFRKLLKMNQKDLSEVLNISQSTLSQIENSYYAVSIQALSTLYNEYNLNTNWLVTGEGEMFLSNGQNGYSNGIHDAWPSIPIVYEQDQVRYQKRYLDQEYVGNLEHVHVPGIRKPDAYRIFQMAGDSMIPSFTHGDFLIAKKIQKHSLSNKRILAVVITRYETLCKRIYQPSHHREQIILENDHTIYPPEPLMLSDVQEIWAVVSRITNALELPLQFNHDRFQKLEEAIEELKKKKME